MASNLTVFLRARGFYLHSRSRLSCVDEWRVPDCLVKGEWDSTYINSQVFPQCIGYGLIELYIG